MDDISLKVNKILQDNESKKIFMRFFKEMIQIDLQDIIYDGIERFQSIVEYDFFWVRFIGIDEQKHKRKIFLKKIKKGKIRESLFCICDLLYEKYFNKLSTSKEELKKTKKITILENKQNSKLSNAVDVSLFIDDLEQEKIEIEFIEIFKLIEQNEKIGKGWKKYVELNQNDILVVGIEK